MTELRSLLRKTKVLRFLQRRRVRGSEGTPYEEVFNHALMKRVRAGDCVWDVGANLGHYTALFGDTVGPSGQVYAFEPSPACYAFLRNRFLSSENVRVFNLALGEKNELLLLHLADNPLGATHSLTAIGSGAAVEVEVAPGDELVNREGLYPPSVLKVDVEGFEEEVINGLKESLTGPSCRAVLCEIHFRILDERGRRQAPARIISLLRSLGYTTTWLDPSHLAADR